MIDTLMHDENKDQLEELIYLRSYFIFAQKKQQIFNLKFNKKIS